MSSDNDIDLEDALVNIFGGTGATVIALDEHGPRTLVAPKWEVKVDGLTFTNNLESFDVAHDEAIEYFYTLQGHDLPATAEIWREGTDKPVVILKCDLTISKESQE